MARRVPQISTFSEAKRLVWFARNEMPGCRYGQAFCNVFDTPSELESIIYEDDELTSVAKKVMLFFSLTQTLEG